MSCKLAMTTRGAQRGGPRRWCRWLRLAAPLLAPGARGAATISPGGHVFESPFATKPLPRPGTRIRVVSWNVAAVNNNPFEYWITHPRPEYKELMDAVEEFIVSPKKDDVEVNHVFTDDMFARTKEMMKESGMATPEELETVEAMWRGDYRSRRVVSEFLKDPTIGKKRLASMPDRVTNTIQLHSGATTFRPTVINCYEGEINSLDDWFEQWLDFFFKTSISVDGKAERPVHSLLQVISKSKYPAVTLEEEAVSRPLQLILQGVFDAILVNLMLVKGGATWQPLRREICGSLNSKKNERLVKILSKTYHLADVFFLQEVGNKLTEMLKKEFGTKFDLIVPGSYNPKKSQNSIMLLRKSVFSDYKEVEVPPDGWEAGDLLLIAAKVNGRDITLGSFHGDTNGLLTVPMLNRVMEHLPAKPLLFGLDANTHEKESDSTAHVLDFERAYQNHGLESNWGKVDPKLHTTYNARTYLQPQLNKAAKYGEMAEKGDKNPKDFILFTKHFAAGRIWRDNTGLAYYVEDTVFPTLDFPSDHAAIAADLMFWEPAEADREEL